MRNQREKWESLLLSPYSQPTALRFSWQIQGTQYLIAIYKETSLGGLAVDIVAC